MKKRYNIVYIHSHDTGRFIQPYGAAVSTPNLQQFADEGVLFRQAFCTNPTCSPSRASLLSGQYPHVAGMFGLAHLGFEMNDYSQHLASHLGRCGYHTVLAGHQHEIPHGREAEMGYEEILGTTRSGMESALSFLSRESFPEPFFLSVGFWETHRDFLPAGPQDPADRTAPPPGLPDTPETRRDMADFKATVRSYDAKVGIVLNQLKQRGLNENTVVVLTTDHGIAFPGYKCTLTDNGIGVLLVMRFPGGLGAGQTVDSMVSHMDVFPTLCEVADIPVPDYVQGKSMMPLIHGEQEQLHDEVFAEINFHVAYEPARCIRTNRYKYIRRFSDFHRPVVCNADHGFSRDVWLRADWHEQNMAEEELYDLILDPCEKRNLIADSAYFPVAEALRERLKTFMSETKDPLCDGAVHPPDGAVVAGQDWVYPHQKEMERQ
jgi:N-sulfoglucosamine sulfohydrolase